MKQTVPVMVGLAIALAASLLVVQATSIATISHDDGISYLAATGHQGLYAHDVPSDEWVPASAWQSFWTPSQCGTFSLISNDLASQDIHPPLYLWLLHAWSCLYGVDLTTGPLLNVPFHVVAAIAVFLACRQLKRSQWASALAAAMWLLNGPNLFTASETRQYVLLSAVVAWFVVALLHFRRSPSWRSSLWVCLLAGAGLLTHYHFAILLAALSAVMGVHLVHERAWRTLAAIGGALLLAACIFYALHPGFYMAFDRQAEQAQAFTWAGVPLRVKTLFMVILATLLPERVSYQLVDFTSRYPLVVAAAVVAGFSLLVMKVVPRSTRQALNRVLLTPDSLPFVGWLISTSILAGLYLSFMSPEHAMAGKYLMLTSPLLFISLAQCVDLMARRSLTRGLVFGAALLASQIGYASALVLGVAAEQRRFAVNPVGAQNSRLVLDSIARGVLPTILWHADPASRVLAGTQETLQRQLGTTELDGTILYVSDLRYGNSESGREAVLHVLANRGYRVTATRGSVFGVGTVYELQRSDGPQR